MKFVMILFFQRLTAAAAASAAGGQSPEYLLRINQRRAKAKAKKISKMKKVLVLNQVSLSSIQFPSDALILRPL